MIYVIKDNNLNTYEKGEAPSVQSVLESIKTSSLVVTFNDKTLAVQSEKDTDKWEVFAFTNTGFKQLGTMCTINLITDFGFDTKILPVSSKASINKFKRPSKANYYLNLAEQICTRGTCLRRNYGAVIVKDDEILSTGYTGAPRGRKNCVDIGTCKRKELNIPSGERYELCRSVHAEANAIISASRKDMIGATLYLAGLDMDTHGYISEPKPCKMCERLIINAGIKEIVSRGASGTIYTQDVASLSLDDDN